MGKVRRDICTPPISFVHSERWKKETTNVILKLKYFYERHRLLILCTFWHGKQKPCFTSGIQSNNLFIKNIFISCWRMMFFFSSLSVRRFVRNSMKSLWKISINLIARQRTDAIFIWSFLTISPVTLYLWKLLILRLRNSFKLINW